MVGEPQRRDELKAVAKRLGIVFNNLELLDRALTHASATAEPEGPSYDYETLEFLGDAALGLAMAHQLFTYSPDRTPGEYTRMRAGLVSRRTLSRVAGELDIAPAIRLGRGEELSGGRERGALLADCLEALIGALYLDQGWPATYTFVARVFADEFRREHEAEKVWDFKSRLQNYCQARKLPLPVFNVVSSEGPDHRKEFEVQVLLRGESAGRGRGTSKKEAEQRAARAALETEGQHF